MAYLSYGLYRNATEIHENIANKTILKIFASKTNRETRTVFSA